MCYAITDPSPAPPPQIDLDILPPPPLSNVPKKRVKAPKGWGTRHTFMALGFLGFGLCYALRFNISIAIVSMVDSKCRAHSSDQEEVCHKNPRPQTKVVNTTEEADGNCTESQFKWSEEQQGLILGSFFWGYVITQYPGGRMSHVWGAKWIFSIGILITGLLSLIIPMVTFQFDHVGLTVIRFLQGLAEGVTLPSILVMIAHWSPVEERSRVTNWIYAGIPVGTALTMVSGGYLINYFGWPSIFYACGGVTILWFILWSVLVYDEPSTHPCISTEEIKYIQAHLDCEGIGQKNIPTPWLQIVKSMPVWAILVADLGDSWAHYLLHVEVPIYLNAVHGFDIETNGWFSALPQIVNCLFAIAVAYVTDFIIRKKYFSVIATRKTCSMIALWGSCLGFIGMILGGCNTIIALIFLNFAAGIAGTSTSGWVVNHIEIAPNHAGTISGVANTIGNSLGFVAPYVTGIILESHPSLLGWRVALAIPVGISFAVSVFYLMFASSEEQSWNRPMKPDGAQMKSIK